MASNLERSDMQSNQFALRLKRLFEEKRKPDGKKYSQTEVLEGLQGVVTRVYLWKLRNGRAANPSYQVIRGLADFFGVSPGYFFESDETPSREWDLAYEIELKVSNLSREQQQMVLAVVESLQKTQKTTS